LIAQTTRRHVHIPYSTKGKRIAMPRMRRTAD
jgi:hypothetical protein